MSSPDSTNSSPTPVLKEDRFLDKSLRPTTWDQYIGQENIKKNLRIILDAAAGRNQAPEHMLFYGPPGLGKTTLAHLIAKELGGNLKVTSGPAIEKVGDLASILTNLTPGDILFIDEIHRLNKMIEEVLYPAMESGSLHIIIGKGPGARTIELSLPPFTLIAATTRMALLSAPLRSRFSGGTFRLDFYNPEEIATIVKHSAAVLDMPIKEEAALTIAKRSRYTPRIANHLLKRCRDFAQLSNQVITSEVVSESLTLLGIDQLGLTEIDRQMLKIMIEKFGGGPVGVNTIATALAEEEATIEEVYEPYLIQIGFIERTPRGRVVTDAGFAHFGLTKPEKGPTLW